MQIGRMVYDQIDIVNKLIESINISGNSVTNSRRRIIAEIVRKEGLFTSEELAKSLPNIGRATVYRTLRLLYEQGSVCRINIVDDHSYYTLCNKIDEINLIGLEKSIKQFEKNINGEILSHNLEIYILCSDCT